MSEQLYSPASLTPGETAIDTNMTDVWVDPRAGLDTAEKTEI
jgi:hypothetical protein